MGTKSCILPSLVSGIAQIKTWNNGVLGKLGLHLSDLIYENLGTIIQGFNFHASLPKVEQNSIFYYFNILHLTTHPYNSKDSHLLVAYFMLYKKCNSISSLLIFF